MLNRLQTLIFGKPRDLNDPGVFHRMSLIAFLAWVGLGADGLSSSTYGPEETFRMLGTHPHLTILLALAMIGTIAVIAYAYSRVIEHFPVGGGGYVVASTLLGPRAGLVSGAALLVDYALTISVSIAAAGDAFFSFLPMRYQPVKLAFAVMVIVVLTLLNLRGVKESITLLAPIFLAFLATHAVIILGALFLKADTLPALAGEVRTGFRGDLATLGWAGVIALCLRAYSFGCGTYTGIEAVSNGLAIMREPKVETGKRTMLYMALSLALTASGLILAYLLFRVQPVEGRTMNATLAQGFSDAVLGAGPWSHAFVVLTLLAEAALLVVAAQAGFIDGPRVMANMASDSWLPRRLASLSDRLTIQDGVLMMSGAAVASLLYARGHTSTLVVMYSINVFLTFTLTETAMIRFWLQNAEAHPDWRRKIAVHITGFFLCVTILVVNLWEKFFHGGWVTIVVTLGLIGLCLLIRRHYEGVRSNLARLDQVLAALPSVPAGAAPPLDPRAPTAALMVGGHFGLGVHSLLTLQRVFPGHFKNVVFVSVGVVDSGAFRHEKAVEDVRESCRKLLDRYLDVARRLGLAVEGRMGIGTDVLDESERVCLEIARTYPRLFVFCGKLIFQKEALFHRFLHNDTAYSLQRRLQFAGLESMVLPVRVLSAPPGAGAGRGPGERIVRMARAFEDWLRPGWRPAV